jgi:uncharacterized alkaline shock family protein YloU
VGETVNNVNVISEDSVRIADEVIGTIAGIAASEVESLAAMRGGFVDGLGGMFGVRNHGKGIKVESKENEVTIDMSIIVQYGCKIHEVAREIQVKVRKTVEDMTGLKVAAVNINVLGISLDKDLKKVEVVDEAPPMQA